MHIGWSFFDCSRKRKEQKIRRVLFKSRFKMLNNSQREIFLEEKQLWSLKDYLENGSFFQRWAAFIETIFIVRITYD